MEKEIIIKECIDMLEKTHSAINYLNNGIKDNNKDVIKQCNKIDDIIEYLNELNKQNYGDKKYGKTISMV